MTHGDSENVSHLIGWWCHGHLCWVTEGRLGSTCFWNVGRFWFSNKCTLGIPSKNSYRHVLFYFNISLTLCAQVIVKVKETLAQVGPLFLLGPKDQTEFRSPGLATDTFTC